MAIRRRQGMANVDVEPPFVEPRVWMPFVARQAL
jgi:hypothetical protein